jgi:MATE family multidrug resistance protein
VGAQLGAEVGIFALSAVMMGWLGPVQLAAHQVTINVASTTYMVPLGASIAGSVRVGQHVGAGNRRGVHRAALATYLVALSFMGACALSSSPRRQRSHRPLHARPQRAHGARSSCWPPSSSSSTARRPPASACCAARADTRIPHVGSRMIGYWGVGFPVGRTCCGFRTPSRTPASGLGLTASWPWWRC